MIRRSRSMSSMPRPARATARRRSWVLCPATTRHSSPRAGNGSRRWRRRRRRPPRAATIPAPIPRAWRWRCRRNAICPASRGSICCTALGRRASDIMRAACRPAEHDRGGERMKMSFSRRAMLLALAMAAAGLVPLAAAAPRLLGHMYGSGLGVRQDFAQAMEWYRQAAERGDRSAQWSLGLGYMRGLGGLPVDQRMAAQLFQRAAEQGFAYAQGDLGMAYEFGEGVPRNRQMALHWLDLAAAQGYGRAHWYADWLRRPDTPQFQTVAQLDGYINGQVMATNGLGRRGGGGPPPPGNVWNGQSYGPANPVTGAPCHSSLHHC